VLLSATTAAQLPPERLAELQLRSLGVHRLRDIAAREAIFQLLLPGLPAQFPPLNTLDVAFRAAACGRSPFRRMGGSWRPAAAPTER
jgi:hypothetical protein